VPKSSKQVTVRGEVYYSVPNVALKVKIHRATLSRWASRGETPEGDSITVVRDKTNGHLYISAGSVRMLEKSYIPDVRFEPVSKANASSKNMIHRAQMATP
jgi:hypothetical protein